MVPVLLLSSLFAAAPTSPAAARDFTPGLRDLIGIGYVNDAALDETGRWTFFEHPEKTADAPGLNCSGFVLAAAQRLLGCKLTLAQATHDRLGDSGDESPLGKDWDFGFDLVLNLSEGLARRAVLPDGTEEIAGQDGRALRGFAIDDEKAWGKVLPRLKPGFVYLASMSRVRKHLEHHHVTVLLKDAQGRAWFYQTLPKGHGHRLDLSSPAGYTRMQSMFGPGIRILIVEVEPPAAVSLAPAASRR